MRTKPSGGKKPRKGNELKKCRCGRGLFTAASEMKKFLGNQPLKIKQCQCGRQTKVFVTTTGDIDVL